MAIKSLSDDTTKDIYQNLDTKAARRVPKEVWPAARRRMAALDAAKSTFELGSNPSNHFKVMGPTYGEWNGWCQIRINLIYRLHFIFKDGDAYAVTIQNYHGRTTQ